MKTCKCGAEFVQYTTLMNKCAKCLADNAKKKREEDNKLFSRDDVKKARKKLKAISDKDKPKLTKKAQSAFNSFIRKRDELLGCISCDRTNEEVMATDGWKVGGAWDCGHFLTRGGFPELRFEELNAHKQCKTCNGGSNHYAKKARLVSECYRVNLIKKIGLDKVEWLEGPHEPKKYTIEELKEIEQEYKRKLKELN